ncbi:tetratricopeptide repeat protein [Marinomonas algicola]|uniref:tetratricopeptide repeat protein n=1 Tax=Marinomonas algicola TaxID=2773454 RepID=UPI00174CE678|nr:tetratricopeptide repeat protein [Marinomonas algicola]
MKNFYFTIFVSIVLLSGCSVTEKNIATSQSRSKPLENVTTNIQKGIISANDAAEVSGKSKTDLILMDLLNRGQKALSQMRLLTPEEDNANMYFQAALGRDPKNPDAIYGLAQIVTYYTRFAWDSAQKKQFNSANKYIELANLVNPNDPLIKETQKKIFEFRHHLATHVKVDRVNSKLNKAKNTNPNAFFLPKTLFSLPEDEILQQMQPIIDKVTTQKSSIEINWVNDKEARLLYQIINSRVPDFRVRGMIFHRPSYMIEVKQQ